MSRARFSDRMRGILTSGAMALAVLAALVSCEDPMASVVTYKLTIQTDGKGTATPAGTQTVNQGVPFAISATPAAGYLFAGWIATNGTVSFGDPGAAATTATVSSGNAAILASFSGRPNAVSFDKNDVGATGSMSTQIIATGATANLATCGFAKPGYGFAGWSTTAAGSVAYADGAPYAMGSADVTLYAKWSANNFWLSILSNDHGSTSPSAPTQMTEGVAVQISATADAGYHFSNWTSDGPGTLSFASGYSASSNPVRVSLSEGNASIYANFANNSYRISFDKNDDAATGSMEAAAVDSFSTTSLPACAYVKAGYSFAGWATIAGGNAVYADKTTYTMGTADAVLYAKWTGNPYSITFDKNDAGATGTMAAQIVACGSAAELAACGYAKTGHSFAGWAASPGGAVLHGDRTSYTMGAGNVTLYAKWTPNGYAVSFNKNDAGATGSMDTQSITFGTSASLAANLFSKSGWTFIGWATTSGGSVAYANQASYTMGAGNATLYARWDANDYLVTFNKGDAGASGSMPAQTIACGSTANLDANSFSKPGWAFAGWATVDGGPIAYADRASYTMGPGNDNLYAKWAANSYVVTFDKNDAGAEGTMGTQAIASGASAGLDANAFTKSGWSFAGWATTPGGSVVYADGAPYVMGSANATLYAKWTANNYSITFDKNDASATGSMSSQTIACGSSANLATNAFAKTGWTFAGWATISGGSVAYADQGSYTMGPGNATLYAKWTANNYSITFDKNDAGATGSMSAQTIACGSSANLTANAFAKAGWTFAGWATTSGGSVAYANQASYTMGAGNVTLYAKWTASNYTVTFNGNGATSGSMGTQTIACGSSANLTANAYAMQDRVFAGWATTAGGSVAYADQASYTMGAGNVTLYAKWTWATYSLRDTGPAGGLIFYINANADTDGWKYLECAPSSTEWSSKQWGTSGTTTGAAATIGSGPSNTALIVAAANAASETDKAAQLCDALVSGSRSDWFLPSLSELVEAYNNLKASVPSVGGFGTGQYWASTESNATYARAVGFNMGDTSTPWSKTTSFSVRAVRRF